MGGVGWVAAALSALIGVGALLGALLDQFSALSRKAIETITAGRELREAWVGQRAHEKREEPQA